MYTVTARGRSALAAYVAGQVSDRNGPLARSRNFITFVPPEGVTPSQHAMRLMREGHPHLDGKPVAGCVQLAPGEYLFFGWAGE